MNERLEDLSNEDYIGEYDIVEYIALGFLTHNDSYDKLIRPGDGHLRFDGSNIYFIDNNGKEKQSHTVNHAIKVWLEKGFLTRRNSTKRCSHERP